MGFTKKRRNKAGKYRYTACYIDVRGRLRSAGTFSNKKDADRAWQASETKLAEGRVGDPARGRQKFRSTSRRPGCRTTRWSTAPARATPTPSTSTSCPNSAT